MNFYYYGSFYYLVPVITAAVVKCTLFSFYFRSSANGTNVSEYGAQVLALAIVIIIIIIGDCERNIKPEWWN